MKLITKSLRLLPLAAATLITPAALTSCQWMHEDYDDAIADHAAARYINISVSVSAGAESVTRAPLGGEYGDGYEKGFEREHDVQTITLIFYQDGNGVNTNSDEAKILDIKTFPAHKLKDDDLPTTYGHTHKDSEPVGYNAQEVLYSTGNQLLPDDDILKPNQSYKVIVVANADPRLLSVSNPALEVGMTVKQARDAVFAAAYSGTGVATDANTFIMSSESDATVKLDTYTVDEENNTYTYYLDCIHIERLAARIDFFAKTKTPGASTYQKVDYNKYNGTATTYDHDGYVYPVGTDGDFFVLTRITPFNLMNGNEYMLKRSVVSPTDGLTDAILGSASPVYLADEEASGSGANWVLDPYSALATGKNSTSAHPEYLKSTLESVKANFENTYTVTLSGRQTETDGDTEGGKFNVTDAGVTADNVILGYPRENTLRGGVSSLYYYATGLAFEGYYYKKDETEGSPRVFYHYIRHQGESSAAYKALTESELSTTTLCPATPVMNYGIVRNNIYRVSIESITPDETTEELYVKLLIKVKKWDKFVHTPIYM